MDETRHNDVECWNDFLQRDEIAFGKIYRRFYSLLYAYGIRMVGNRELVIDTIQDLFVKLILNCKNLHPTDNPEAYLLCAFRNKLLDAIQSSRRMETIEEYAGNIQYYFFGKRFMVGNQPEWKNTLFMVGLIS